MCGIYEVVDINSTVFMIHHYWEVILHGLRIILMGSMIDIRLHCTFLAYGVTETAIYRFVTMEEIADTVRFYIRNTFVDSCLVKTNGK